eukprot:5882440-Prymnesium_polylepis.2
MDPAEKAIVEERAKPIRCRSVSVSPQRQEPRAVPLRYLPVQLVTALQQRSVCAVARAAHREHNRQSRRPRAPDVSEQPLHCSPRVKHRRVGWCVRAQFTWPRDRIVGGGLDDQDMHVLGKHSVEAERGQQRAGGRHRAVENSDIRLAHSAERELEHARILALGRDGPANDADVQCGGRGR